MSGIANPPSSSSANVYWTMDISVNNAILLSNQASQLYLTMPHTGTLVDMFVTAQGVVNDTGHIFVTIGTSSVNFAFLNPPNPPLAKGSTLSTVAQGFGGITAPGQIATNTSIQVSTNGLGSAGAAAEVYLQLVFQA